MLGIVWASLAMLRKAATSGWRWVTTGSHWKIAVAAMTVAALILAYLSHRSTVTHLKTTQEALSASQGEVALLRTARTADTAALSHGASKRLRITTKETNDRKRTEIALEANRDWADHPVPPAVLDSLRP